MQETPATPSGDGETPEPTQFKFPVKQPRSSVVVSEEPATLAPQVSSAQTSATTEPPPPQSSLDPNYTPLDLPSRFAFYSFKQLSATMIRGKHQAKFALAAKRQSTRLAVEAVSSLLGDGVQAKDLTISDFYSVMYWLRLNCYGKVTFPVNVQCTDHEHIMAVVEKKLSPESLKNSDLISNTSLKESVLDLHDLQFFLNSPEVLELNSLGYGLTAPRMSDSIELEEEWEDKPNYAEVEFLTDLASSIYRLDGSPLTLTDRFEIVGNFSPANIGLLRKWQDLVQSYGVEESISLKCKGCGSQIVSDISISAHDFL